MNRDSDRIYYLGRAQVERERAKACTDTAAAIVHATMAAEYERRAGLTGQDASAGPLEPSRLAELDRLH